jgi:hypothetical protein
VFLELGMKHMLEYLSFDQKSMKLLLSEENKEEFSSEFPLFYKDHTGKSAIDTAFNANLLQVVDIMIAYLCKNQNNYAYTNLVSDIFVQMMLKGISVKQLLSSEICTKEIIYNEWPEKSFANDKTLVPYNASKLSLQYNYSKVFKRQWEQEELELREVLDGTFKMKPGSKVAKLRFDVNMLPGFQAYKGDSLLQAISETDELEIFKCDVVKDFIDYKFDTVAYKIHRFGLYVHLCTVGLLMFYVNATFMGDLD